MTDPRPAEPKALCPNTKCNGHGGICPHGTPHGREPECRDPVDINCPDCVEVNCENRDHYGQRWKDWPECQDCLVIENCSAITLQRVLADKKTSIAIIKENGEILKTGGRVE